MVVGEMKMNIELHKVEEDFQVYRYENGYMLDIGTRDEEQNWKRKKIICNEDLTYLGPWGPFASSVMSSTADLLQQESIARDIS